jgi:hypothetical protein
MRRPFFGSAARLKGCAYRTHVFCHVSGVVPYLWGAGRSYKGGFQRLLREGVRVLHLQRVARLRPAAGPAAMALALG